MLSACLTPEGERIIDKDLLARVAVYTDGLIIISDKNDRIVWVNQSLMDCTGYSMEELRGQKPGEVFRGPKTDDEVAKQIDQAYQNEQEYECEILNYTKKGEPFWLHLTMNPIEDADYYIAVGTNITERKRREAELKEAKKEAQKLAEQKQNIISVLGHDIKSPLSSMLGSIELLEDAELGEESKQLLKTMEVSAKNMLNLVKNMAEMSKIESGSLSINEKEVSFKTFIDDIVQPLRVQAQSVDTELKLSFDDRLDIDLLLDPVRFSQVLNNLVSNSIKFTPEGTIHVLLKQLEKKDQRVEMLMEVHDNGCGITPAVQKSIFGKYEQAETSIENKYGGTGLGLTITKHIVEEMGGRIWLESEEGVGTSMFVRCSFESVG